MGDVIRVLIVDDSLLMRTILTSMIQEVEGFEVIGQAADGLEAVKLTASLRPDVITMDIRMPHMNGLDATRQIMSSTPTPIVVVASSVYEVDLNIAFNAVAAGALTVVEKPHGLDSGNYGLVRDQLVAAIRLVANVKLVTLLPDSQTPSGRRSQVAKRKGQGKTGVIAMAASTGGPGVLRQILGNLPVDLPVPILVTQHITAGFAQGFANWLDSVTPLQVSLAKQGEQVLPGHVLIAPEGMHMIVTPGGTIQLDQSPPVKGQRPSATRLFDSVARVYGPAALGIVLTGMGDDGVDGLSSIHLLGGQVIAQDEASCVVFGMPKVAIDKGIVDQVLSPLEIVAFLNSLTRDSSPANSSLRGEG